MKNISRHRGLLYSGAAGFVFGAAWILWMNSSSSDGVIARWSQPALVDYRSFDPYTLYVVEVGTVRTLFGPRPEHEIRVSRGTDASEYGHRIGFGFDSGDDDMIGYIRDSQVTWTDEGVTLQTPSEHRIFIPKRAFIGGR